MIYLFKYMEQEILKIKKWADEIAGSWNGDEAGYLEERATCANELSEKCNEILELIKELQ